MRTSLAPTHISRSNSVPTWPEHPYRGLNYFEAKDQPLFAERDNDIDICEQLLSQSSTRILLLHGLSGTGKSSFLRAGLLPRIATAEGGFHLLQEPGADNNFILIRATDDPLTRLHEAVATAFTSDDVFKSAEAEMLAVAQDALNRSDEAFRSKAENLYAALQALTCGISSTLVLVMDQCEEVFTLQRYGESAEQIRQFFEFLDYLYTRPIDIKVILSLRTEYYGQFCHWFRIEPNTRITPTDAGLEQYMLRGIRDSKRLEATIVRPTLKADINSLPPPYLQYGFEYEEGLPAEIAKDLIEHCGESSTLPVMQIVCSRLHHSVVITSGRRIITRRDYLSHGRVPGGVAAYVEEAVAEVLHFCNAPKAPVDVQRWVGVLSSLVAEQEGGGVTTLITSGEDLMNTAADGGFGPGPEKIIAAMASPRWRLLRQVSPLTGREKSISETQYSLGHDAIAASLYQSKEQRALLDRERRANIRQTRNLKFAAVIGVGLALAGGGFVLAQAALANKQAFDRLIAFAKVNTEPGFRLSALLLVAANSRAEGISGLLNDQSVPLDGLRSLLERSPIHGGVADAVGFHPGRAEFALLEGELVNTSRLDGVFLSSAPLRRVSVDADRRTLNQSDIGFISGLSSPVILRNDHLHYFVDGSQRSISVDDIVHGAFAFGNQTNWIEIAGSAIRVYARKWNVPEVETLLVRPTLNGELRPSGAATTLTYDGPAWPTISQVSERAAVLVGRQPPGNRVLVVAPLDKNVELVDEILDYPWLPSGTIGILLSNEGTETEQGRFFRSVAFSSSDAEIAVRENQEAIKVFSTSGMEEFGSGGQEVTIPEEMRSPPQRMALPFQRPLLAFGRVGERRLFAWLGYGNAEGSFGNRPSGTADTEATGSSGDVRSTERTTVSTNRGIHVMEQTVYSAEKGSANLGRPLFSGPLLHSIESPEIIRHLGLSQDGRYLFIKSQRSWTDKVNYFVWDISSERKAYLKSLDMRSLIREACRVARLEPNPDVGSGPGQLSRPEQSIWLDGFAEQPCASQ